jgi:hypothetical protein
MDRNGLVAMIRHRLSLATARWTSPAAAPLSADRSRPDLIYLAAQAIRSEIDAALEASRRR